MLMDHLREYNLKELERNRQYRVLGRTGGSVDPLSLFWTGSALELNLRATELWVTLESSYMVFENWIDVMVNGALIQRFMVPKGRSEICLFRGMDRNQTRNVRIVRDTQAMHLDPRNSLGYETGIYRGQPDLRRGTYGRIGLYGVESGVFQRGSYICLSDICDPRRGVQRFEPERMGNLLFL